MAMSDNAKEVWLSFLDKFGGWIVSIGAVIAAVATLFVQQHNQHKERMAVEERKVERIDNVAAEVKAASRPLVYGTEKPK